jgi:anaerobic magnesium-protoporphyrin IX monomethyl ester cyclase
MKFLFIYPASGKWELAYKKALPVGANLPPLGILYLSKMLEMNGHNVEVLDFNAEYMTQDKIKEKILSSDAIGMTVYSEPTALKNSIILSNFIKKCDPDIPVLLGGPHCCIEPEKTIISHNADILVEGEGELVINPIADAIQGKGNLSNIPGVHYRENDKIIKGPQFKQIDNLDAIPFPARHLVEKYEYGYFFGVKVAKGKTTSILTSRGCPMHCRFCGLRSIIPGYQSRTVDNITKEIEEIVNAGYKTLSFVDDNFTLNKRNVEKIMDFIIKNKIDINIWIEGARIDSADRDLYKKMRDAGVEIIHYGIESGNQDVLDYYDKKITISQIKKAVSLCKEMGFYVNASFILGAPIETKEHIENTIKFAKSIPLDSAVFYNFSYVINSPIWDEAVKEGKIKPEEYSVNADSNRGLGNFTEQELIDYTMKAYKKYYFDIHLILREILFAFTKRDFRFLKIGLRMISSS